MVDLNEDIVYRCKDCYKIPSIKLFYNDEGSFLDVKCENKHSYILNLKQFKDNSIFKCYNCLKELNSLNMFYCYEIKKVFCNECKLKNSNYRYIHLIKYDSFCLKHSNKYYYFCKKCMENLCEKCLKEHQHKNYIYIQKYLSNNLKKTINSEINYLINNINELEKLKVSILKYLNEFIELNKNEIIFYKNIYSTFLFEENQKNLNCNVIENLKTLKIKFSNKCVEKILNSGNKLLDLLKNIKLGNNTLTNIKTINTQNSGIYHLSILKNGDFASSSSDGELTIYDKKTFNSKLVIYEHYTALYYFTQLKNGNIITCSGDKTMKIIELNNDTYNVIQTINCDSPIYKVIEINNLISVSNKGLMQIWEKNKLNNIYYNVTNVIIQKTYSSCNILQISNNEIVTASRGDKILKFWDFEFKNIFTLNNIETQWASGCICMLDIDILCVATSYSNGFYLIQISTHQIINKINGPRFVYDIIKCIDDYFLAAVIGKDYDNSIIKYKYENGNFIFMNQIVNIHEGSIHTLVELENGLIVSGSNDRLLKIWE